ncbi:hypothetical protein Pst134EB_026270 [Puccinia striiformis f. sp. tritici]|nr:hypothetical protein Pst134EB_026270 [Puccinia striiformis f. sp. tritici]
MLPVYSFKFILLFQAATLIYGLPLENASSAKYLGRFSRSCKSIKQRCTGSVKSTLRSWKSFTPTTAGGSRSQHPRFETSHGTGACSACGSSIVDGQDLFKWTTCTEGHTFHRACVSPSRNGASSCPTCEELAPHIEHLQIQEPMPQSPESGEHLMPGKASEPQADRCAICLAEWGDQDVMKTWPECAHNFHEGCVSPWRDLHSTCPICRTIDPALLEKENVSVRQQEQVHHEEVFTPLMESFMRILTQIGIPRDQNETDQVNHLRQFFRERQDAHEARTRETFPPSENQ